MAHPCQFGDERANVTPFTIISDCDGSRLWSALSQVLEGASNNETACDVGPWCNMNFGEREEEWALLMRGAIAGDSTAYHRFLLAVAPYLRATARRQFARIGAAGGDHEDIVQEVLLAIHLKRHTWDQSRAIGPWVAAITRNKAIDMLRRRGRQTEIPIEDVIEQLPAEPTGGGEDARDVERMLAMLNPRQRDIIRSVSVNGASIREVADRLEMSEGAVRVALHRALKALAARYRSDAKS
jgi:RNA polymerase sigma factor (sigma-70 family)